jgi:biopolymer transport protein TolR
LAPRISAIAGDGYDKPIFVRADGGATYAVVAQVMAGLSNAGFSKINLITETGGPSSGVAAKDAQPEGSGDLRPAQ